MNKSLILVVEDDFAVRNLICTTLEAHCYEFLVAKTGTEALNIMKSSKIDIILLDLGLPDIDGINIIKEVRKSLLTPIIVISARGEDKDKIEALDAGADDYLTKPFSVDELLARLRVTIRRLKYLQSNSVDEDMVFVNGELKIDYSANCVFVNETELHLTPIEYKLLVLLAQNVGKVLTHSTITKVIWGSTFECDIASLRVFMATLRKKIEKNSQNKDYIQTHVGVGYRMLKL